MKNQWLKAIGILTPKVLILLITGPYAWASWTSQTSGTGEDLDGLYFPVDANTGWVVGDNGVILITTDGGTNWNAQTSGTSEQLEDVFFPVDANTGWVVGDGGVIRKTTDGGTNWSSQTSGTAANLKGITFPVDVNTGWVVGDGGVIRKTTDGGTNWNSQTSGTSNELRFVHFPDASNGYIAGFSGIILKTTDGGSNWSSQTSGTGANLRGLYFPVDANTGWVVGDNGVILRTTDGGTNWIPQTSGTSERLEDVFFPVDANTGYAAGDSGTILKTDDGGGGLKLFKRSFLSDGTPISSGSSVPKGTVIKFMIYINNAETSTQTDISVQDVLDTVFAYQTGTLKVNNTTNECAAAFCTSGEETTIFTAVDAVSASTDAVDGDVVSITGSTIDAGNQNAANAQLDIAVDKVWALLFMVKVQ